MSRTDRFMQITHRLLIERAALLQQRLATNTMLVRHFGQDAIPMHHAIPPLLRTTRHHMGRAVAEDQIEIDEILAMVIELETIIFSFATMNAGDPIDQQWLANALCTLMQRWTAQA